MIRTSFFTNWLISDRGNKGPWLRIFQAFLSLAKICFWPEYEVEGTELVEVFSRQFTLITFIPIEPTISLLICIDDPLKTTFFEIDWTNPSNYFQLVYKYGMK